MERVRTWRDSYFALGPVPAHIQRLTAGGNQVPMAGIGWTTAPILPCRTRLAKRSPSTSAASAARSPASSAPGPARRAWLRACTAAGMPVRADTPWGDVVGAGWCRLPAVAGGPVTAGGAAVGWVTEAESGEETGVPYVDRGGARIWYTERGTGFPMLTLAPGGMRSSVPLWELAAINPLTAYAGHYRMIAMDQRNAGQSAGPLEAGDPWGAYAADQLAVMDHAGIGRFLAFGCCIGGPFILKLLELAPDRVVAADPGEGSGSPALGSKLSRSVHWNPAARASRMRRHGRRPSGSAISGPEEAAMVIMQSDCSLVSVARGSAADYSLQAGRW